MSRLLSICSKQDVSVGVNTYRTCPQPNTSTPTERIFMFASTGESVPKSYNHRHSAWSPFCLSLSLSFSLSCKPLIVYDSVADNTTRSANIKNFTLIDQDPRLIWQIIHFLNGCSSLPIRVSSPALAPFLKKRKENTFNPVLFFLPTSLVTT